MLRVCFPRGTQIETNNFANILTAIEVAHQAIRLAGAKRIITTVRIDERLDRFTSLEKKVDSMLQKL
ncbi:MAG: thiamine-binding protein [Nitrososphaeraceae archaeon]